jgi:hypothetical protein
VLACVARIQNHEAEKVCDYLSIAELVGELMSHNSAPGAALASLLLVLGLDCINKMFRSEVLLIELLDLDSHVVQTLEVHSLRLCMPNFLPLALQCVLDLNRAQKS